MLLITDSSYTSAAAFKTAITGVYLIYELATPVTPTITPTQYNTLLTSFSKQGSLVNITLPTSAGTVYGGTLIVNPDGTGTLVVDRANVDLGTLTWGYESNYTYSRFYTNISDKRKPTSSADRYQDLLCSMFKSSGNAVGGTEDNCISGYQNTDMLLITDSSYTDAASFKTAMSGVQLVYELATPVEYTLSAEQVIESLQGQNNVWADTGNILKLSYRTGVTTEMYNESIAKEEYIHARVTFLIDNVVFQDGELESGGIQLSTYMNPDQDLQFGYAYCTEAIVRFLRSEKTDSVNFSHEFTIEFGTEINGEIQWVMMGHFSGTRPVYEITANTIELTAYDKMARFDRDVKDYISLVSFPCTLQDVYDGLCSFLVMSNEPGDEISSVMGRQVEDLDDFDTLSCRELLAAIAEANGCYAKVTNEGNVKLIWFEDHTSDFSLTLDNCFSGNVIKLEQNRSTKWGVLENTLWKDIESVQYSEYDNNNNPFDYSYVRYRKTDENIFTFKKYVSKNIVQPPYDPYYNRRTWANIENFNWEHVESMRYDELELQESDMAGNTYTIINNPFVDYTLDTDIRTHLQYILDKLYYFHLYYVAQVSMVGNWLIEPGDIVLLEIFKNNFVSFPIFNRTLRWNGACECGYETTGSLTG